MERWLPVGFKFGPGGTSVNWVDFGSSSITEPFFHQTIARLKAAGSLPARRVTNLATLFKAAAGLPQVVPSGVIFHVSRCGSTLLSNVLRAATNVVTLSEARPIVTFLWPMLFNHSIIPESEQEDTRRRCLNAVTTLYAHAQGTAASQVVVKCCTINILNIPLARSFWPDVPFVVMIRNPIEVMVSNLSFQATWLRSRETPRLSARLFGWEADAIAAMSLEEFCARGVGRFYEAAANALDQQCTVIDYDNLNLDTIYSVAERFGLTMPARDDARVQAVARTHAKDPNGVRPFCDDREQKQLNASSETRALAARLAMKEYLSLRHAEARWGNRAAN